MLCLLRTQTPVALFLWVWEVVLFLCVTLLVPYNIIIGTVVMTSHTQSYFSWLVVRQFGAGGDFHHFKLLLHFHNNFVAIKTTVSVAIYTL